MTVIAYKWGGIAFDDYSLSKVLMLPTDSDSASINSFHNEAGSDYQVPANHIFVAGGLYLATVPHTTVSSRGYIGESDTADAALTKTNITLPMLKAVNTIKYLPIVVIFAAGKYITVLTTINGADIIAGTALYGVEIDIS